AYEIAPHQNGMVAIMIPQIRFSDRPLMMCRTVRVRYAPEQPNISILDEEWVAAIQKSIHV
ncbi:MAG: hypothetical protein K6T87_11805, partial [Roseiflexus sp.]|uniref:hypothetical protein n=1 Tax=Roseiflexus sp. TaxID=2562120 RepID=UPI0025EBD08F